VEHLHTDRRWPERRRLDPLQERLWLTAHGRAAHYRAVPGTFLRNRSVEVPSEQPPAHVALAIGDLLDRNLICRRCPVRGGACWVARARAASGSASICSPERSWSSAAC